MKAVTFPLPPPRVPDDPLGGVGLCRRRPACPDRPALYAVRVPRCRGSASGLLSTPPRDDAVAIGSELAPPLPPEDFHLPVTARDGLDHPTSPRSAGGGRKPGGIVLPPAVRGEVGGGRAGGERLSGEESGLQFLGQQLLPLAGASPVGAAPG